MVEKRKPTQGRKSTHVQSHSTILWYHHIFWLSHDYTVMYRCTVPARQVPAFTYMLVMLHRLFYHSALYSILVPRLVVAMRL